jgi:hypothetical protein
MPGPGTWSPGDILTADDLNAIGAWESYTPVLTQNGARTATVNYSKYVLINTLVIVNVDLTCTDTGSAGNIISVSTPLTAVAGTGRGSGFFFDSSANDIVLLSSLVQTTTTFSFFAEASTSAVLGQGLGNNPSVALGNNDVISFSIVYQAA